MARRGDPKVLRLVVVFLRSYTGMTQTQFGKASRVDQADVSRFESGRLAPSEETLRRMAKVAGIDWSLVVHLRQFYTSFLAAAARDARPGPEALNLTVFEPALRAVTSYLFMGYNSKSILPPDEENREAEQIWTALEGHPVHFRRRLIELSPRSGSWALAVRACEASVKSAARHPGEALELAELALSIAERFPGEEGWRSRLQAYCWAHVGNARHLANDLSGAAEAFARARHLWQAGGNLALDCRLPTKEGLLDRSKAEAPATARSKSGASEQSLATKETRAARVRDFPQGVATIHR